MLKISFSMESQMLVPLRTFATEHFTREHSSFISKKVWKIAYSPDERLFAWTAGDYWVTVVLQTYRVNSSFSRGGNNNRRNSQPTSPLLIQCQYPVTSISLGAACERDDCFVVSQGGGDNEGGGEGGGERRKNCRELSFWRRLNGNDVPSSVLLATGHNNGRIRIWDAHTGKLLLELLDNTIGAVGDLSFEPPTSRNGRNAGGMTLASVGEDCRLRLWNLHEDGHIESHCALDNRRIRLRAVVWSPDGRWLAVVGGQKTAILIVASSCEVQHRLEGHRNDVTSCSFSPDSALILTASYDTRVILWLCLTGQQLRAFNHLNPEPSLIFASGFNGSWVRDVSFSADGKHFTTVADDGYVRVWHIERSDGPEYVAAVPEPLCCRFTPSGRAFVVGTKNGEVSVFVASGRVRSLQFECRLVLREWLASSGVGSASSAQLLQQLNLPQALRDYLTYDHIIDDI